MAEVRVQFTATVVFRDGGLRGVEMTCLECDERGWKGSHAMVEHALTHPQPNEYVTISRQLLNHLEQEAGLNG